MSNSDRCEETYSRIRRNCFIELAKISNAVSRVLKDNFIGFYVMGSFVMGDWDPERSDIDFIVVTKRGLSKDEGVRIGKLHDRLLKSDVGGKLDGAYTYLQQLQQKRFNEKTGSFENHKFIPDSPCHLSSDNVLCLLQYGKCIMGKPIVELSLSVSDEELAQAARDMLIEDADEIDKKNDFETLYYVLIDMLRCIYTLETKTLPTKPKAVEHCRQLLGKELCQKIKKTQNGSLKEFKIDKNRLKLVATYGLSLLNSARERDAH